MQHQARDSRTAVVRGRACAAGLPGIRRIIGIAASVVGIGVGWFALRTRGARRGGRDKTWNYRDHSADEKVSNTVPAPGEASVSRIHLPEHGEMTVHARKRRAQRGLGRFITANPLIIGVGALMLGAAVGLAVPESRADGT